MTTSSTLGSTTARTAPHAPHAPRASLPVLPRRERRTVSYCNIWDLVAPGEPCPTCEVTFEERLARARASTN